MNEIIKDLKTTYEINKSTFITYLKKVNSVDEAKIYIQEIKNKHKIRLNQNSGITFNFFINYPLSILTSYNIK